MLSEFAQALVVPDHQINLARAALLYARDAYPELDPDAILRQLDAWAMAVEQVETDSDPSSAGAPFARLNTLLFERLGFQGNTGDYYDPRNSYLNEVIERRTGLPITISVVYLEIGWRTGLPLHGVGLPGHFIVRCDTADRAWFVDPFNRGQILSQDDCARIVKNTTGNSEFDRSLLRPATRRQILTRMLGNLRSVYVQSDKLAEARTVMERLIEIEPDSPEFVRDLGLINFRLGTYRQAIQLLESYFTLSPQAGDLESIRQVIHAARVELTRWN